MEIKTPENVEYILSTINNASCEAYIVGGCVRDILLGRTPEDWDITTSATPGQIKELFPKTVDTGLKHGTVTVVLGGENYEVTTFRIEGKYEDNRRPSFVEFTSRIESDLARRDFTCNAVAYHPAKGFVDPFGGREDIRKRTIRAVGDASKRYAEDALRMLRAVRFSAKLNFSIERQTFEEIGKNSRLIENISCERIRDELTKLLISDNPDKFDLLRETGLLAYLMPEFEPCYTTEQRNPWHIYDVAEHSLRSVSCIEQDCVLRWTMLLHDIGKPCVKTVDEKGVEHFYGHPLESVKIAEGIIKRLRFDNLFKNRVLLLIKHHDREIEPTQKSVRKAIAAVGEENFLDLVKVNEADRKAQNPKMASGEIKKLQEIKNIYLQIKEEGQCIKRSNLAINGRDLIGLGIKPGKEMGELIDKLFSVVLEDPSMNSKEKLEAKVPDFINKDSKPG